MPVDEPLVVQALLAVTAAIAVLCVLMLLLSTRSAQIFTRENKPVVGNWARCWLAETLGTFALVFSAILSISGTAIGSAPGVPVNLVSVGLAQGFAIAVMVAALGAISGGHFNPAVTFGFVVTGRIDLFKGILYWSGQFAGAVTAAFFIASLFGQAAVGAATPDLGKDVNIYAGMMLEAVTTFFLVLVVFGTTVDKRAPKNLSPLAIGFTVALNIMVIGPLTGGAMNPARAFGPALAAAQWANHFVYWLGPLAGGGLAALVYHYLLMEQPATIRLAESTRERRPADRYLDELAA